MIFYYDTELYACILFDEVSEVGDTSVNRGIFHTTVTTSPASNT